MASWRDSARAAAEPELRALEEKRTESNSGERKAEKMGSEAKASRGEGEEEASAEEAAVSAGEGLLKVPSLWSGEDGRMPGDAMIRGGVLAVAAPATRSRSRRPSPRRFFSPSSAACNCRLNTGP